MPNPPLRHDLDTPARCGRIVILIRPHEKVHRDTDIIQPDGLGDSLLI